jgi:hypothetical protein
MLFNSQLQLPSVPMIITFDDNEVDKDVDALSHFLNYIFGGAHLLFQLCVLVYGSPVNVFHGYRLVSMGGCEGGVQCDAPDISTGYI